MKGFTLPEALVTVALIGILAGVSMGVYNVFKQKNSLEVTEVVGVAALRRAQSLSESAKNDSDWGVYFQSGQVVVFEGADYATRDVAEDEIFEIDSTILVSGDSEIVFEKLTGFPIQTGQVIFSNSNDSKTITIGEKGVIEF